MSKNKVLKFKRKHLTSLKVRHKEVEGTKDYSDRYTKSIYNKYDITHFNTREEFENFYRERKIRGTKRLNNLWQEYLHRDELIRRGSYNELRMSIWRDNYMKELKNKNVSKDIQKKIRNLSDKEFQEVMEGKIGNKEELANVLPTIREFYDDYGLSTEQLENDINRTIDEYTKFKNDSSKENSGEGEDGEFEEE